jgi:hypothetical protein
VKLLFDQGVPVPLRTQLPGHRISTAFEQEWSALSNGRLLDAAESAGFDVLVTTDKNLRHQQNLAERRIAVLVLPTTRWPVLKAHVEAIRQALDRIRPGDYEEVVW